MNQYPRSYASFMSFFNLFIDIHLVYQPKVAIELGWAYRHLGDFVKAKVIRVSLLEGKHDVNTCFFGHDVSNAFSGFGGSDGHVPKALVFLNEVVEDCMGGRGLAPEPIVHRKSRWSRDPDGYPEIRLCSYHLFR